ncbi:MAG: hypothetical protein HOO06_00935 [Bdellovibrionaceae bacterium]|jgi:7,8-dihydro-6-hydroxymethylpterin-pyrophosphokinase|nr:hypothetical protein [Pseudobdellovibrionaceae bacterium]
MAQEKNALITVVSYLTTDQTVLKTVLGYLKDYIDIEKISSVYQVMGKPLNISSVHDIRSTESYRGLCVCLKCSTTLEARELVNKISVILEKSPNRIRKEIKIYLLAFEAQTKMTQDLSLPFPEWHNRPELIVPAADIWHDYNHPVLNETIGHLAKKYQLDNWGEFFTQGDELV